YIWNNHISRLRLDCGSRLVIESYHDRSHALSTAVPWPIADSDYFLCWLFGDTGELLPRVFQWIGMSWDPTNNRMHLYLDSKLHTMHKEGRCWTNWEPYGRSKTIGLNSQFSSPA